MKIGIDIHETIDAYPAFFSKLTKILSLLGVEIHITTGSELTPKLINKLAHWQIKYDYIFSVTDYHKSIGTTIIYDGNREPWILLENGKIWDRTKADYCKRKGINLHIDDSPVYGKYFRTPYIRFSKETIKKGDFCLWAR